MRIGLFVLVFVVYAHAQTCKVHNDCPDSHANRHCCNGQCGNCQIRCRNDDNCLSKYNDACCFKPETNFGSCMKRPEPGKRECWYEDSSGADPVIATLPPITNPPVTDPPIIRTQPPTTMVPGSTLPYENRFANYVCCWDTGRSYGHCSPKDSAPADCYNSSVTQGPGHQRCFNSNQCSRIKEPPNCCPEKGQKWGYCKRSCNDPLPENRCFLDKMCTTADSVCCWRSNEIHGNCYKRELAPSECQLQSLTQQPGLHLCYNSFQCTFYGLSQPQECCYVIGDTPGLCQSSCSSTSPLPPTDSRCFVDIHCNDMNNLVCCWKRGSIHGQCTRKDEAPKYCGLYKSQTIRPNEQNCYNDWQCKLSGSPPKCCGANGETFGQCKNLCGSSDVASASVDPRCFVDAMCEDNNKVCCWSEGTIHGQCTSKSQQPNDCKKYTRTPAAGVASMCYVEQQCRAVNAPSKCCFANGNTPGWCQNNCDTQTTSAPAVSEHQTGVCCFNDKVGYGICTPLNSDGSQPCNQTSRKSSNSDVDTRNKQRKLRSRLQSMSRKSSVSKLSPEGKKTAKLRDSSTLALACSLDAQCTVLPEKYTKCCFNDDEGIGYCCSL
ncbi:hypothetical protein M3Y98_00098200 [Aphelenchoides besseyi]|nr:hypothetical protein M3Y98_00098200 [Aphelenchoides besseyi]